MVGVKRARPLDAKVEYQWRVERARSAEYVADFALIGERALRRRSSGRTRLFKLYFLELKSYKEAMRLLGIGEGTFDYWSREIRKQVGRALFHAGLYPPERYFNQPSERDASPIHGGPRTARTRAAPSPAGEAGGQSESEI
jgi:hypothetical protein